MIEQERRFAQVAERYQETLAEQEPATLALLQRLCLFRLGADAATLTAIFTGEGAQTSKVTGPALAALTAEKLQQTLDRLVAMKLVEQAEQSGRLEQALGSSGISAGGLPELRGACSYCVGRSGRID